MLTPTLTDAVLYYAPQIFASFGFSSNKTTLLATGVTGILQIIFTLPSVLFLDKFGRKTFLIIGAIGMCICHICVASIDGVYEDKWALKQGLDTSAGWASIAFIWLFAVNFAYSWVSLAYKKPKFGLLMNPGTCCVGIDSRDISKQHEIKRCLHRRVHQLDV